MFKAYTIVNTIAVLAAASTAATLILVSGLKRETAITDCQAVSADLRYDLRILRLTDEPRSSFLCCGSQEFYPPSTTNSSTSVAPLQDSAEKICQIFTIVDVSVMG